MTESPAHGDFFVKGTCISGPAAHWRQRFLQRARDVQPKILESLHSEVLPGYSSQPVWPIIVGKRRLRAAAKSMGEEIPRELLSVHEKLVKTLVAWAEPFHLAERCILYEAVSTLSSWEREGVSSTSSLRWSSENLFDRKGEEVWMPIPVGSPDPRLDYPAPFRFEAPGWNVQLEKGKDWQNRVVDKFHEARKSYVDELKSIASEQLGTYRSSEMSRFIDWFARYQLDEEMTYEKLAGQEGLTDRTIRRGVKEASEMIDLERRPARKGRPKGARDSEGCQRQLLS